MVEVQEIGRAVVGLEDRQILLAKMGIAPSALVKSEEEREIRIVGVQEIQAAEVESMIAGNGREEGMQQVVASSKSCASWTLNTL